MALLNFRHPFSYPKDYDFEDLKESSLPSDASGYNCEDNSDTYNVLGNEFCLAFLPYRYLSNGAPIPCLLSGVTFSWRIF